MHWFSCANPTDNGTEHVQHRGYAGAGKTGAMCVAPTSMAAYTGVKSGSMDSPPPVIAPIGWCANRHESASIAFMTITPVPLIITFDGLKSSMTIPQRWSATTMSHSCDAYVDRSRTLFVLNSAVFMTSAARAVIIATTQVTTRYRVKRTV